MDCYTVSLRNSCLHHLLGRASNVNRGFYADYDSLQRTCLMKPLRGEMIRTQRVEKSLALQVHHVGDISLPALEEYFKDELRSGGGQFETIMMDANQDCMVIEFGDETGRS